jgi:beta-glucanase (GH16 family)
LWAAEFNEATGTRPDATVWTPLLGNGFAQLGFYNYGTGEIESNSADAAAADGKGNLAITTQKQNGVWTSARIWTQGKLSFQYGKIEARIKMPVGSFNWPAFWMLGSNYLFPNGRAGSVPWPNSGEIDIAETLQNNQVAQSTLHANYVGTNSDWLGGAGLTSTAPIRDFTADFHTYGMLWEPNSISFTLDGVAFVKNSYRDGHIYQSTNGGPDQMININGDWPFNKPFFLILDNAVPAGANAPDGTSSQMLIDWIHYSTYNGQGSISHS